jgi:hypothetical protein
MVSFMENSKAGEFQFKIAKRISDVVFHVEGNAVSLKSIS